MTSRLGSDADYDLEVASGPRLRVSADGCWVDLVATADRSGDDTLVEECVLGPALLLALALQGTFALHASAVAWRGSAIAFVGESGLGKSTLSSLLGAVSHEWQRIGDDVLPITTSDDGPVVLPHYPQLKLSPNDQAAMVSGLPEAIDLAAICVISDAQPTTGASEVAGRATIRRLSAREATLSLVRHTLASRLFAPDLSGRHLAFCTGVPGAAPVLSLSYPRRIDIAPEVASAIIAALADVPDAPS